MANPVNPPPQLRIPNQFLGDKEASSFFQQINVILFQLWQRSGGSKDLISDSEQALTSTSSRVSRNAARIYSLETAGDEPDVNNQKINRNSARVGSLELKQFKIEPVTADFTASGNQILICKNAAKIDVTLDPNAVADDEVHIKRRDAEITVVGSIDGFTNRTINIKNYSMHLVFDGVDWSEI